MKKKTYSCSSMDVLLVDDEPGLLDLGKLFMEKEGVFEVTTSSGAKEALDILSRMSFDIIVSDYEMPEMDGLDFLRAMKHREDETPFIMFTGRGREEVAISALNEGADFYVQKGGDPKSQFGELFSMMDYAVANRRAWKQLEENEGRLRLINSNINDVILETDMEGVIEYTTPSHLRILGRDDVVGRSLFEHIHPEDVLVAQERFQEILESSQNGMMEYRYLHPDGGEMWIEAVVTTYNDSQGRARVLVSSRDISDRKRVSDDLEDAQAFMEAVFDGIQDGICVLDREMNVIRTNHWIETVYSDMEPLVGKKCYNTFQQKDTVCQWCPAVKTLETGKMQTEITPWPSENDPQGWHEITSYPMFGKEGRVEYIIEHVKDISDQEEAKKQSQYRRDIIEFIICHIPVFMYIYDIEEGVPVITYVTANAKAILGVEPEELMGDMAFFESFVHPKDLGAHNRDYLPTHHDSEYRLMGKDGRYVPVKERKYVFRSVKGRDYVVGIIWNPDEDSDAWNDI